MKTKKRSSSQKKTSRKKKNQIKDIYNTSIKIKPIEIVAYVHQLFSVVPNTKKIQVNEKIVDISKNGNNKYIVETDGDESAVSISNK